MAVLEPIPSATTRPDLAPRRAATRAVGRHTMAPLVLTLSLMAMAVTPWPAHAQGTPLCGYQVKAVYPHDPAAFTQGLVITDGTLYEGTGLLGESSLREVDLESGAVLRLHELPDDYFGEGITAWGDRLIQLTYVTGTGLVYDRFEFALIDQFYYSGEGWGLTGDGQRLIMTDGGADLIFRSPVTYQEIGRVAVYDDSGPVVHLNELESIRGQVYANVWPSDHVVIIDPRNGRVVARIDLSGLLARSEIPNEPGALNGIAYDADSDRLFVTGKRWPSLFEIELVDCPLFWDDFENGDLSNWARHAMQP